MVGKAGGPDSHGPGCVLVQKMLRHQCKPAVVRSGEHKLQRIYCYLRAEGGGQRLRGSATRRIWGDVARAHDVQRALLTGLGLPVVSAKLEDEDRRGRTPQTQQPAASTETAASSEDGGGSRADVAAAAAAGEGRRHGQGFLGTN
jgi:hypothetical protein